MVSEGRVVIASLASLEASRVLAVPTNAIYSPPGFLVYSNGANVLAQRLDLTSFRLTGGPMIIGDQVKAFPLNVGSEFSISLNGVLAYHQSSNMLQLAWYRRDGKRISSVGEPGQYGEIQLSLDDKRLAVERITRNGGSEDIWIAELSTGIFSRATFDPGLEVNPVWSPDGRELVFTSDRNGSFDLYRKVVGGGPEQLIFASHDFKWPHDWLNDGKSVVFTDSKNIYRLPLEGDLKPMKLLQSQFDNDLPKVSPDEHWVVYQSDESGRWEIYLAAFPMLLINTRFPRMAAASPCGGGTWSYVQGANWRHPEGPKSDITEQKFRFVPRGPRWSHV